MNTTRTETSDDGWCFFTAADNHLLNLTFAVRTLKIGLAFSLFLTACVNKQKQEESSTSIPPRITVEAYTATLAPLITVTRELLTPELTAKFWVTPSPTPTPEPTVTPEPTKDYSAAGPFIDLPTNVAGKRYRELKNPQLKGVDDRVGSIDGVTLVDYIPTGEETADALFGFSANGIPFKFWMTRAPCGSLGATPLKVGSTYEIGGEFFAKAATDLEPLKHILELLGGDIQSPGCQARINLQPISPDEMSKYFRGEDPSWGGKIRDLRGKLVLDDADETEGLYINHVWYPAPPTPTPIPTPTP